jgi:cytochrome oxidase assembly protein ShyY1
VFLLVQLGLNELGFWQISRAQEKQQILNKLANSNVSVLTSLELVDQEQIDNFARLELNTTLFAPINLLVENKIQNGKLGYHVVNLLKDESSNKIFLVNRGWVEGKANRQELPYVRLPPNIWQVSGRLYQINPDVLSSNAEIENHGKILRLPILDSYTLELLAAHFELTIEPYILRLDSDVSDVYEVDWEWVSMKPEKHLGYAFQWFALSLAFLLASLYVLIKKRDN